MQICYELKIEYQEVLLLQNQSELITSLKHII